MAGLSGGSCDTINASFKSPPGSPEERIGKVESRFILVVVTVGFGADVTVFTGLVVFSGDDVVVTTTTVSLPIW